VGLVSRRQAAELATVFGLVVVGARRSKVSAGLDESPVASHTRSMTTTAKLAISLPKEVAEQACRAVRQGHATSLSAYIASALEKRVMLDDLSSLLDEMLDASGGPMTAAERRTADRALGVKSKPRFAKSHAR
jgi:hypothetical protein